MMKFEKDRAEINNILSAGYSLKKTTKKLNDAIRIYIDDISMMPGVQSQYNSGHTYKNSRLVSEQAMKENKFHLRGKDRAVANEHPNPLGLQRNQMIKDGYLSKTNFKKISIPSVVITKDEAKKLREAGLERKMPFEVKDVYNIKDKYARYKVVGIKVIKRKVA